jgi:hypothetical protein
MLAPLMIAASLVLQAPSEGPTTRTVHPFEIQAEYRRVRNYTALTLDLPDVFVDEDRDLYVGLRLHATWPGTSRGPLKPSDEVRLVFLSSAEEWAFPDVRDLAVLAGSERMRLAVERTAEVRKGRASESLACSASFVQLAKMAGARSVEMALGPREFQLDGQQLDALRDMARRLSVPSDEAEKIDADRRELIGRRREELKAAMAEAVVKAKARVGGNPSFEDVLDAFDATERAYRVSDDEIDDLLEPYPEVRAIAGDEGDSR